MTDAELLSTAIKQSGLSVRRFAVEVLVRDPRTVFRWLRGVVPATGEPLKLPLAVRAHLEKLAASHDTQP